MRQYRRISGNSYSGCPTRRRSWARIRHTSLAHFSDGTGTCRRQNSMSSEVRSHIAIEPMEALMPSFSSSSAFFSYSKASICDLRSSFLLGANAVRVSFFLPPRHSRYSGGDADGQLVGRGAVILALAALESLLFEGLIQVIGLVASELPHRRRLPSRGDPCRDS